MQQYRLSCPASHAVLQLLPHFAAQYRSSHAAEGGVSALLRRSPRLTNVNTPTTAPVMCLTCFAASVADLPGSSPLSSNDVRRGANLVMETLAACAPDTGEDALQDWARALLRFDDASDDTVAAAPTFHVVGTASNSSSSSSSSSSRSGGSIGSALADLVVLLFSYAARDMSVRVRTLDSPPPPQKAVRPSDPTAGEEDVNTRWVVLVDLAQLLFSCWELLLQLAPPMQPGDLTETDDGGGHPWSALLGPSATAEPRRSPTLTTVATLMLEDTLGGFTETEVQSAYETVRGGSADTIPPHPQPPFSSAAPLPSVADVRVAQATAAGLHSVVDRLLVALCDAADADATVLLRRPATTSSLQIHEAMLSFHKLCHHVPLLRRLLETSSYHYRCLSRCVLPRLLVLREVPVRALVTHAKGKPTASPVHSTSGWRYWAACSVATALCALLPILHVVVTAAAGTPAATAAAAQPFNAAALAPIASQLTGPGAFTGGTSGPGPSTLAARDGAPLLQSLLHALHVSLTVQAYRRRDGVADQGEDADGDDDGGASSMTQLHERLRLHTLRLLHALCRAPITRNVLLRAPAPVDADDANTREKSSVAGCRDGDAGARAGPTANATWTLMKALKPLLLATDAGAHHAELTTLTCQVLQTLLLSECDGCLCDDTVGDGSSISVDAGWQASREHVVGVTPVRADSAASVSSVTWTALVAEQLTDYASIALNLCWTREAAAPLVGLLECAACTMHRARRMLPLLAQTGDPQGPSHGDAAVLMDASAPAAVPLSPRWQSQQDWRVVFRVAALDVALFERLVRGPVLHDALRGRQLNWDDVLDAIDGVITSVPPTSCPAPSLSAFLRCLEAVAEGTDGSVAGLWSSKLRCLLHEVLTRVERRLCPAAAASAVPPFLKDTAAAMQAWVALLTRRALVAMDDRHDEFPPRPDVWRTALPGTFASTTGRNSRFVAAMKDVFHPLEHRLLLRVVALLLPATGDHLLHPPAVLLLCHFATTRELVTLRRTSGVDDPSTRAAALEESQCLLRIAATLMDSLHSSWTALLPPHPLQTDTSAGLSAVAAPAPSPYAPLGITETQSTADGLLDSLLALYPSAPDMQEARGALLQALLGRPAAPAECVDTAALMGTTSLADVSVCETHMQPVLLLSLASLGCCPSLPYDVLVALLQRRCLRLQRLVDVWSGGVDGEASANAHLAEGAEEEGLEGVEEELGDRGGEADEDPARHELDVSPATLIRGDRCLLNELQTLLQLLVVRILWFGTPPQLVRAASAAPPQPPLLDDGVLCILSGPDARAIMSRVAGASSVQHGLCLQLAHLHMRYRVDEHSLLECLGRSDTRSAEGEAPTAAGGGTAPWHLPATATARHGPSAILFAAAVLSAVLHWPTHTNSSGSPAAPCLLLPDEDGGDGVDAGTSRVPHCTWSYPRALLLMALFVCARGDLLRHLHGLWEPQEATPPQPRREACAGDSDAPGDKDGPSASQRCLRFVASALHLSHCASGSTTPRPVSAEVMQWRRRAVLATHVAHDHLLPLMLHRDRHGRWRDAALLSDRGVVVYTAVLMHLWCGVLFLLAPVMCAFADGALAAYAVDRVVQLQALPAAELTSAVTGQGAAGELLRPLLQLLYLLLVRPSRGDMMRSHGSDITLFTLRVRSAAVALLQPRDTADSFAAMPTGDCVDLCVMATLVYLQAWRALSGANRIRDGGLHAHALAGTAAAAAVADEVGEAGMSTVHAAETSLHGSAPLLPWYGWVPVFRLRWLFTGTTATDAAGVNVGRARCVVLAGFEAALRLCGMDLSRGQAVHSPFDAQEEGRSRRSRDWMPPPPQPPRSTPQQLSVSIDEASLQSDGHTTETEEDVAAALVLDWCAEFLLFAAPHCRHTCDDVAGAWRESCGSAPPTAAVAAMLVVVARLLYLLVHRYGTTLHGSLVLDSVALQVLHPVGPWRRRDFPVLATGWGLAAALSLLCDPVKCAVCVPRAPVSVAEYLHRPEVAERVRVPGQQQQQQQPASAQGSEIAPHLGTIFEAGAVRLEAPAPTASMRLPLFSTVRGAARVASAKDQRGSGATAAPHEIDAILRVLLALDAAYERHGHEQRRGASAAATTLAEFALLPPGTRLVADEGVTDDWFMQESACSPYVVPASVEGAPPLLLWMCDIAGGPAM